MTDDVAAFVDHLRTAGYHYVRFELPDMHGLSRAKVVPVDKVEGYARKGLNMYGGTLGLDTASCVVPGAHLHEEVKYRDCSLHPDVDTVAPVSWIEKTARVICDAYFDGEPITASPRWVLKSLIRRAADMGFDTVMAHEFEFYLLTRDTHEPLFDGVHIFNSLRNQYVPEIDTLLDLLRSAGIDVITHNCEYSPSQFEINYGPSSGILAADKGFVFRNAVKEITHRLGYHATFMSKPWAHRAGNGCHVHISLIDRTTGRNAFLDEGREHGLSDICTAFIEGILAHAPAMMPLINPTPNCYHRLKPHTFAPSNISWGIDDRTAMVRVKATRDEATRIEMRAASALSNPYLSAAATLSAGLLGVERKLCLRPTVDGPSEDAAHLATLSPHLEQALDDLQSDKAMTGMLGNELVHVFTTVKRHELARFRNHITDWERAEYMEVY